MLTPFHSLKGNDKEGYRRMERDKKDNSCVLSQTDLPQEVFPILSKNIISLSEKNK